MSDRSELFPADFRSPFLKNAGEAFRKRTKALGYSGILEWETQEDDFEWLTITYRSRSVPTLILQLWEGNRASFFVRSNQSKGRGKVLIRLENLVLVDNGPRLVSVFEQTIQDLHGVVSSDDEALDTIRQLWTRLRLGVV